MSHKSHSRIARTHGAKISDVKTSGAKTRGAEATTPSRQTHALVFAALGDATRLSLVARLCRGEPYSISQLTASSRLTRQAITKHLRVLESAGIVRCVHAGRESLFELDPEPIQEIRTHLDLVSQQWDRALSRLKSFVED